MLFSYVNVCRTSFQQSYDGCQSTTFACEESEEESCQEKPQEGRQRWQAKDQGREEEAIAKGELWTLHLPSAQTSSSRRWCFQPSDEHHELFRQRHLRTNRWRSIASCSPEQEEDDLVARNPNVCPTPAPWRTRQTCCQRRYQSSHEVHQLQVTRFCRHQKAIFMATHLKKHNLLAISQPADVKYMTSATLVPSLLI